MLYGMLAFVQEAATTSGGLDLLGAGIGIGLAVVGAGIGIGQIDVAWGLYLFTASVMASLFVSLIDSGTSRGADV